MPSPPHLACRLSIAASAVPLSRRLTQTGQVSAVAAELRGHGPHGGPGQGDNDWEGEESLDIEWAHAIAPMANIDLFEANDDSGTLGNLFTAAKNAAKTPGVVAVSMSWDLDDSQLAADPVNSGLTAAQESNLRLHGFYHPGESPGWRASTLVLSTALVEAGNTVTFTAANTFTAGESVTIAGAVPAGFNGTYVIANATANSFTYTDATTAWGPPPPRERQPPTWPAASLSWPPPVTMALTTATTRPHGH